MGRRVAGVLQDLGLRLGRGRLLDTRSLQEDVVVVDRVWADRFFPGQEVLGRRIHNGGCTTCPRTTVVGLVGNVKWAGLDATADGTVYFPLVDVPDAFFILRTAGDPVAVTQSLRRAVKDLDAGLPLASVATGDELVSEALVTPRYLNAIMALFAFTALALAVIGVYGVMAYFVQQRTREIGIRLALGGEPARIRRMIVLHGVRLVVAGVAVGVAAAFWASRLMTGLLHGVSATDLSTMLTVPVTLTAVAIVACLVPARRDAALDPARILKDS
jgi:hypothetical protein